MAVDYFTKWIEVEPLSKITTAQCQKFLRCNIITRFGISSSMVIDNGTQFTNCKFQEMLSSLKIKQHFTSIEHPQANGQAESANKEILHGIKKCLDEAKGLWADELDSILWAYRTMPHSIIGETPFKRTYGEDAIILVEVGEQNLRLVFFSKASNEENRRVELDLIRKIREKA